jgi:hypothetical protein
MEDFKQTQLTAKEANETVITISKEEFIKKFGNVVEKLSRELDSPMLMLLALPIIGEMTNALFDDKKED